MKKTEQEKNKDLRGKNEKKYVPLLTKVRLNTFYFYLYVDY